MAITRTDDLHIVYLDKQPFALCSDRAEALKLSSVLLKTHQAKQIAMLHA
ncbi:hypothetical protein [Synechococcus sp. RSCCF101]|nr:hypothetical protein [Synechococcus sp. RSCCF101]